MISVLTILSFGFLLGIKHATDADHVVAITTLLGKNGKIRHSAFVGVLWGLGHSITVTIVAIPIIFYSFVIPPNLELVLEFFVGAMLVVLGTLTLSGITEKISKHFTPLSIHKHAHKATNISTHSHLHLHILDSINTGLHHIGIFQTIRPVLVGLIHGLAGSAGIALLILSTIKNPLLSAFYLLIFHFGIIIGMMIITTLLGASIILVKRKSEKIHQYLVIFSGIISFALGLYIIYESGVKELFLV